MNYARSNLAVAQVGQVIVNAGADDSMLRTELTPDC